MTMCSTYVRPVDQEVQFGFIQSFHDRGQQFDYLDVLSWAASLYYSTMRASSLYVHDIDSWATLEHALPSYSTAVGNCGIAYVGLIYIQSDGFFLRTALVYCSGIDSTWNIGTWQE